MGMKNKVEFVVQFCYESGLWHDDGNRYRYDTLDQAARTHQDFVALRSPREPGMEYRIVKRTTAVVEVDVTPRRVMRLGPVAYALPASWASYLINGDASGLELQEKRQADVFLAQTKLPMPVSCSEESYFSRYNDAHTGLAGDVLDYSFLVPKKEVV
jgi:hypothetical protein